jgi:hypothetical protein
VGAWAAGQSGTTNIAQAEGKPTAGGPRHGRNGGASMGTGEPKPYRGKLPPGRDGPRETPGVHATDARRSHANGPCPASSAPPLSPVWTFQRTTRRPGTASRG